MPSRSRRKGWLPPKLISERNVKLALAVSALSALVSSMAHGHMFTAFIFELYGDNSSVGRMESVSGLTSLLVALPMGIAVDTASRTKLLRGCAVVGLLASLSGAVCTVLGPFAVTESASGTLGPGRVFTALMVTSLVLWGGFFSAVSSAGQALFADSVRSGNQRQDLFATKSIVTLLAVAVGPLFALACSLLQGNDWSLRHMSYALLPGFLIMPLLCMLLTRFEDVPPQLEELQAGLLKSEDRHTADVESVGSTAQRPQAPTSSFGWLQPSAVPYLLLAAELITSIGSGMTVKFFGLWFKNMHQFSPAGLALLQAATPLCIAAAVRALQAASQVCPFGQIVAMLGFWFASICCLLAMSWVGDWRVLVVLHLFRTALANSKEPLARAILADFIPSNRRGRWAAAHSLTSITWTGSAAIGGALCDRYGYGQTFSITAGIYVVGSLFWLPLVRLVPRRPRSGTSPRQRCQACNK
eukprot:TRINITY_DN44912_c0_g1_i1.p1 TRINITY_DN44912_c0_g1~~TRINITY_DN44912_c0_g1_i1.p1  ORF type:complete len:471 (+),score=57.38 TRINITY_DN44912_c0_g1_i1:133-1545(+)